MTGRALVTGSAGFVGRHLCHALEVAGYVVDGVDLRPGPRRRDRVQDALGFFKPATGPTGYPDRYDVVVHAAAVVGGRTMIDGRPLELAAVDLELDAGLWRYVLRTRPRHVVYLSSSAAYPVALQRRPYKRVLNEHLLDPDAAILGAPDNTYGLVKLVGERLAAEARREGIPVTVVRPFSGYGADQALDYPFPSFIARAARHDDPFDVWGDGNQVRDFVHIDDIAAAIVHLVRHAVSDTVNIATGRPTSFRQLAALCQHAAGYRAPLRYDLGAPTGVDYRVGDPSLLGTYGYTPRITLEEGIAAALTRHQEARP